MRVSTFWCALVISSAGIACFAASASADVSFVRTVAPIVLRHCVGCHGDKINLGGYRAQTFQYLMRRGGSGKVPVVPGKPEESALFRLVSTSNAASRMPKGDEPLSKTQVETIRQWIAEGAKFDGSDPAASLRSAMGVRQHPAAPQAYRTAAPVMALAIVHQPLPDADLIAVGGYNEVTLWSSKTGTLVRRIGHLPQRIQSLACSRDGRRLLVAGGTPGEYGEASLVDIAGASKPQVLGNYSDIALTAVFSPEGARIAVGGADGSVSVYDASSGHRIWISSLHSDWVTSISFSQDGKFVASASRDMTVKLHNASDGSLYTTYSGHCRQLGQYKGQDPVYSVHFIGAADDAISAGGGKWIQLWNAEKAKEEAGSAADMEERFAKMGHTQYLPHGFDQPVLATAVDGNNLYAASADGSVKLFDIPSKREVRKFSGHTDWVYSLDFSAQDHLLVTGAYNGEVRVWDPQTAICVCSFYAQPGAHVVH